MPPINEVKIMLEKEFDIKDLDGINKIIGTEIYIRGVGKSCLYHKKLCWKFVTQIWHEQMLWILHWQITLQSHWTYIKFEYTSKVLYVNVVGCLMHDMVSTRLDLTQVLS